MEVGEYTYNANTIKLRWETPAWNIRTGKVETPVLKIGKFCSIGINVIVYLGGNHRVDWLSTYPFGHLHKNIFNKFTNDEKKLSQTNGNVIIGNDVWIGENVTIMSGVKIGDGAIISTNSCIYEDVKPYSVVGGNPGRFYYFRFNQEIIKKLLELKWWDLDTKIINDISPILCSCNYEELFKYFKI